jgi:CheY-like chemotaxis protein
MNERRPTGLLVDDDQDLLEIQKEFFESCGIRCLTATGGHEAFALLDTHPEIFFVLTDILMHKGSGVWLLERIKTSPLPLCDIPVFLMSGFSEWEEEELIAKGAHGLFKKPFNILACIEKIKEVIRAANDLRD